MYLPNSLKAWGSPNFTATLKQELEQLPASEFPLQQGLRVSSYALDDFSVQVLSVSEQPDAIHARLGIFYSGLIAGCSCADDPTPVEPQAEYCEAHVRIDRQSGQSRVTLLTD
jgi:hypothetical protein